MTREEKQKAINALKKSAPIMAMTQQEFSDYIQTINQVMDWLEQEPCEDVVSRKAVHDMLENLPITVEDKWFNWLQKACMRLAELPPVTPQEPILDKIRAEIAEYGSIMVTYAITKDTKTDKGIEKLVSGVLKQAKEQVLEVIDKYKAESEEKK